MGADILRYASREQTSRAVIYNRKWALLGREREGEIACGS